MEEVKQQEIPTEIPDEMKARIETISKNIRLVESGVDKLIEDIASENKITITEIISGLISSLRKYNNEELKYLLKMKSLT